MYCLIVLVGFVIKKVRIWAVWLLVQWNKDILVVSNLNEWWVWFVVGVGQDREFYKCIEDYGCVLNDVLMTVLL